jgi:hypothetical protein
MKIFSACAPIFLLLAVSPGSCADLADVINATALKAKDSVNFSMTNGKTYLYGTQTNGPDTRNGQWACAKVVSIILIKSGVDMPMQLGVCGCETKLSKWKKIYSKDSLVPGDVVVWTSRFKGNRSKACTGCGTCHIGIFTKKGYFHNDPLLKKPGFGGLSLLGFKFKYGLRPPQQSRR